MLSRRQFTSGAAASFLMSTSAAAELTCRDFPGGRVCTVGVRLNLITSRQSCPEWCWAACVQSVFDFHERKVRQDRIVEKVFGQAICQAAIGPQIVAAIDGDWEDDDGNSFSADAEVLWDTQFGFGRPDAVLQAARELEANRPLIIGALGHATMLTAMTYSGNGFAFQINEIVVRDPWPDNPNRRTLSAQEALATQFLAKVTVN